MAVGDLVQVYVYDLSGGMARAMSMPLIGHQIDGIWHTSVVISGHEYFYGGGINIAPAGTTPFGRPVHVLDLGHTQLPEDIREALLVDLSDRYTPEAYSLFDNNCNNFSNDFVGLLTGGELPGHILALPQEVLATPFGQTFLRPMMAGLEAQLRGMRQHAHHTLVRAHTAAGAGPSTAAAEGQSDGASTSGTGGGPGVANGVETGGIEVEAGLHDEHGGVAVMEEEESAPSVSKVAGGGEAEGQVGQVTAGVQDLNIKEGEGEGAS